MQKIHRLGFVFPLSGLALALLIAACATTPASTRSGGPAGLALPDNWSYALVLDASSSASTLQMFEWRPGVRGRLPRIEPAPRTSQDAGDETWEMRVRPGIASYHGRPQEAAKSLQPLFEFALTKLGDDPDVLANTLVLVRATAGMRLLALAEQSEILAEIDRLLATMDFGTTSARVISGDEEGLFGWLTANYVLGHLEHGGRFPTVGALDLGGASTQITFQPLDYPQHQSHTIALGSNTYRLYSKSYLGLGQDEARERVANPACFLIGYPTTWGPGTGDFDACRDAIRVAFKEPCSEDQEPCSAFGAYQPPLYGDFLALSAYAYVSDFFELSERLRPQDLEQAGRTFCARDWQQWIAEDPAVADNPFLPTYCYSAAHIVTLLTEGFGFPPETDRITAPIRVQGATVGWTLGALLYELAGRPKAL